eukprot:CAMPEP_0206481230 /NCGR_PEP_ID=MMETSP0324_2-20121206/38008_1 /ASSEMBLY_ACC=CAM_ASM_000836 /TAXON_ID=2866 /ORGANISM="Crypthecodinium cohnii, Strain Seligo" /LENGTH=374 /DNA_ID=CAMNT_0053958653 /DNA_START=30 /DNA_END=1154 /DNA_ORIENTATION=-
MANEDLQKKAAAAAAARSKKGNKRFKTIYFVFGALGAYGVAVGVLLFVQEKGPFAVKVNEASQITHINRNAKTWQAAPAPFFDGWSIGDVKLLEGVGISQMGGGVPPCQTPETTVPAEFDAREKWPKCFKAPVYSMGNCTASWATATASAFSDRVCIADPDAESETVYSAQQLLSCDTGNRGCNGGDIDSVWSFLTNEGLVSEACFPYQADSSVSCSSKCTEETPRKASSHCMLSSEVAAMKEIFTNGPVVAPVFLSDDFLTYSRGLYKEIPTAKQITSLKNKQNRIIQAVKVVGWGVERRQKYWLIENSWGEEWGEGGFAKIVRGGTPEKREGIIIETYMVAGTPASGIIEENDDDDDIDLDPSEDAKEEEDI